jgi:hypothetical protein
MEDLARQLRQQLGESTLVVSHTFALPGWQPLETRTLDDLYAAKIYLYRMGAAAAMESTE